MESRHFGDNLLVAFIVFLCSFSSGLCGKILALTNVSVSWSDARSICQRYGMDLVVIEDSAEMARVNQWIVDNGGYVSDCWTGGTWDYGTGSLKWVDNSPLSLLHPEWDFDGGEPDCLPDGILACSPQIQGCVRLTTAGKLRTMACYRWYNVICETPNPNTKPSHKKGLSIGAIIGLVAGFATFIFIVVMCCCIWKTFCGISDDDKIAPDPDGIHNVDLSEEACQRIATDNPWLQHEEISFCLRNKYTFENKETTVGPRFTYIK